MPSPASRRPPRLKLPGAPVSAAPPSSASAGPSSLPPKGASRAIGKKPRMSRFLRILVAITIVMHLAFVAAVYEFGRRMGWGSPAIIAWLAGIAGTVLFLGRARAGAADVHRGRLIPLLV